MTATGVRCAAILAGGASRRMGRNKALLEVEGVPLIRRVSLIVAEVFERVVVVTGDEETARVAGVPAIADAFPGRGPLAGMQAALLHFGAATFCVACDMPFINPDFIRWQAAQLADFDAVVPRNEEKPFPMSRAEPLHAVYAPACLPVFEAALRAEKVSSLQHTLSLVRVRWISSDKMRSFDPELRMLSNWNTPEDVEL